HWRPHHARSEDRSAACVAQTSESAVSQVSKPAGVHLRMASLMPGTRSRLGSRRYSRLGGLRYQDASRLPGVEWAGGYGCAKLRSNLLRELVNSAVFRSGRTWTILKRPFNCSSAAASASFLPSEARSRSKPKTSRSARDLWLV